MNRLISFVLILFWFGFIQAQKTALKSPNGKIKIQIDTKKKLSYNVSYKNTLLLSDCGIQMMLQGETLGLDPKLTGQKQIAVNNEIRPIVPLKYSIVKNEYNQLTLNFKGNYSVQFRAFDDGIAYRFITNKKSDIVVLDEEFSLNFPNEYDLDIQTTDGFKTPYEGPYAHLASKNFDAQSQMSVLPILIDTKKQYKMLLSEADQCDYPVMLLKGTKTGVVSAFPKYPSKQEDETDRSMRIIEEANYIAKTVGNRSFPWRFVVISENDTQLIENTMVCRLASPSKIEDTSWIKAGQTVWDWWNYAMPYDVDFAAGRNQETYKYFIDFAAENNIPYTLIDEGWAKSGYNPYETNPTVDMPELVDYANNKNVKILLWLPWLAVENNLDKLFKVYSQWGIAGVKVDFMERNDQWMVNYYERVAKEAAENKLIVLFHGSFKPAGLEYIYPNILSYEGVRGLEWKQDCTPNNSVYFPFIRNAVGPMDYTPGAMMSMQPEYYANSDYNPAAVGTRAYQLSHFVIFESGIQMLADNPTRYNKDKECFDFISNVPVTWDETIALAAEVGEYVVVAKRKADQWFIGAMTNSKKDARTIEVDLNFLSSDKVYAMTAFEDGPNANKIAMDYKKRNTVVRKGEKLTINMAKSGGWAAVLK